jgi:hypothetical protein
MVIDGGNVSKELRIIPYLWYAHAQYDLCLKILFVVQAGGLRVGKTQGESDYEPAARSLRRGTP